MRQSSRLASDLAALLLCASDHQLDAVAEPLGRMWPAFRADPIIREAGARLSRCAVHIADHIERCAAVLPSRAYGEAEADILAACLSAAGVELPAEATLAALAADVEHALSDRAGHGALQELALALARIRLPVSRRARRFGVAMVDPTLRLRTKNRMVSPGAAMNLDQIWRLAEAGIGRVPVLGEFFKKVQEEQLKIGKVNILVAGKTGVGKSTLINAVFGESVATTGAGRPVTAEIRWYEPAGLPVRLCDTKGLELADFGKILADLRAEIERSAASGKVEDRIHLLWLCVAEPSTRVEEGEIQLARLCENHRIPTIVVLTKAIGPRAFAATIPTLIPEAKRVTRVLAETWDDEPPRPPFGLPDLIRATHDLLPEATQNAFDAVQRVVVDRKRARALDAVRVAAGAAGLAAATPIPVADAAAVLSVNVSMIAGISVIMGVQMSSANIQTLAGSMAGALAVTGGGRLIAGEIIKLIPGFGSVVGGIITSGIAASATYGLGFGYIEFLCRFQAARQRMPDGEEIKDGFRRFWEGWEAKELPPPK